MTNTMNNIPMILCFFEALRIVSQDHYNKAVVCGAEPCKTRVVYEFRAISGELFVLGVLRFCPFLHCLFL